jgi:ceroid-lipofuscinosis neuronal protein 6
VYSFELTYYYDEYLGHTMWYLPFFLAFCAYFAGCFLDAPKQGKKIDAAATHVPYWASAILLPLSSAYWWYLVTEGQITPLFIGTLAFMVLFTLYESVVHGRVMDANGKFLFESFLLTAAFVAGWVAYLWNDKQLRERYPGLLYVPEPWSFYTLYFNAAH